MIFDADNAADAPWDFKVRLGGQLYATRPLSMVDLSLLAEARANLTREPGKLVEFLRGIFIGDAPVNGLTVPQMCGMLKALAKYQAEWTAGETDNSGD